MTTVCPDDSPTFLREEVMRSNRLNAFYLTVANLSQPS